PYLLPTPIIYPVTFFFFNHTAPTDIYTLSLHDALPISPLAGHDVHADDRRRVLAAGPAPGRGRPVLPRLVDHAHDRRARVAGARDRKSTRLNSSRFDLVCRLLLEKKRSNIMTATLYREF